MEPNSISNHVLVLPDYLLLVKTLPDWSKLAETNRKFSSTFLQICQKKDRRQTVTIKEEGQMDRCGTCRRSFVTSTDLMVHETCHNKATCCGCNQKFDTFEQLSRHRARCQVITSKDLPKPKTLEDLKRKMPKLIFDTCCGCIELKTGCFIIGYLQLVGEIIFSIFVLLALVAGGAVVASDDKDAQAAGVGLIALGVIMLLMLALLLAFTITLLVGLHKNKRGHVKAYLIYCAIFIVLGIILFFAGFSQKVTVQGVIGNLISLLLEIYFFLVIRSQYHKMDDANKGAIYNTA